MQNKIFICIEEMQTVRTWYKKILGNGTVKVGTLFKLEKEPTPEKKTYKLVEIVKNPSFTPIELKLRKSDFMRHFKEVENEDSD